MHYAFIDEAWGPPPSMMMAADAMEPQSQPQPQPKSQSQTQGGQDHEQKHRPHTVQRILNSLYKDYGFKDMMNMLPSSFLMEVREHFSGESPTKSQGMITTDTLLTLIMSALLAAVFYDALTTLFRN
jgi:hypothetical protein